MFPDNFTTSKHDGIYDRCSAAQAVTDVSVSMLDSVSLAVCTASPPEEADDNPFLHVGAPPLERTRFTMPGLPYSEQGGVHRCLPEGVGGDLCDGAAVRGVWMLVQCKLHIKSLELLATFLALKQFRPVLRGQYVLIMIDNTTVVSFINKQEGTSSLPLFKLSRSLLLWCSVHFLSLSATNVPGCLNLGQTFSPRGDLL